MPRRVLHITLRCRPDESESQSHSTGPAASLWALELRSAIRCARSPTTRRFVMKAEHIMTRNVISVQPETTISEAANLMLQHRISGLPVVDRDGHVVGIVTEGDFLRRAETGTQRQRPRWLQFLVGQGRLADEYVRSRSRRVEDVRSE